MDYKERMKQEATELGERIDKLNNIINAYYQGSLDFELTCHIYLLESQLSAMRQYYRILCIRAKIEGVEL